MELLHFHPPQEVLKIHNFIIYRKSDHVFVQSKKFFQAFKVFLLICLIEILGPGFSRKVLLFLKSQSTIQQKTFLWHNAFASDSIFRSLRISTGMQVEQPCFYSIKKSTLKNTESAIQEKWCMIRCGLKDTYLYVFF